MPKCVCPGTLPKNLQAPHNWQNEIRHCGKPAIPNPQSNSPRYCKSAWLPSTAAAREAKGACKGVEVKGAQCFGTKLLLLQLLLRHLLLVLILVLVLGLILLGLGLINTRATVDDVNPALHNKEYTIIPTVYGQ